MEQKTISVRKVNSKIEELKEAFKYTDHVKRIGVNRPSSIFLIMTGHVLTGYDVERIEKLGLRIEGVNFGEDEFYIFVKPN